MAKALRILAFIACAVIAHQFYSQEAAFDAAHPTPTLSTAR